MDVEFALFPNPTDSYINIDLSDLSIPTNITLFAADGRQLLNFKEVSSTPLIIDLQEFPKGIYFLRIAQGDATAIEQVVVQ